MSASPPSPGPGWRIPVGPVLVVLSVAAVGVQLYGLYRPVGPPQSAWFPAADKVAHLLGFAVPVVLVLTALAWYAGATLRVRTGVVVLAVFAAHGVLSEIIQARLYADRSGDPADVLADLVGVALGALVFIAIQPSVIAHSTRQQVSVAP